MRPLLDMVPIEVIDIIIDTVAENEDSGDQPAVKACLLACQTFLPRCRKHIFFSMHVFTGKLGGFLKLLTNSPWIANHIRVLLLVMDLSNPLDQLPLYAFDRLTALENFGLYFQFSVWTEITPAVRSALLRLMHLPTITSLCLGQLKGFLPADLAPCINLEFLTMDRALFKEAYELTKVIKLKRLHLGFSAAENMINILRRGRTNDNLIFDFRELRELGFGCDFVIPTVQYHQLLKDARHLETLHLCMRCTF